MQQIPKLLSFFGESIVEDNGQWDMVIFYIKDIRH